MLAPRDVVPDEFSQLWNATVTDSTLPTAAASTVSNRDVRRPDAAPDVDRSVLVSGLVDLTEVDFGDAMGLADADVRACCLQLLETARNPGRAAIQGTRPDPPRVAKQRSATP
jgi:hypothetical protein